MNVSDGELWQRVLANDASAWSELVNRYQALVYTVVTRSGLSMQDAADCFQQTWVSLYEKRHAIKDPSRLSAWLVTTSRRETLRVIQQQRRHTHYDDLPEQADHLPLPDEELELLERQGRLEVAFKALNLRCRRLLNELFFAPEEKSYAQVAASVGITFNSLGPIRGRCLKKLRDILLDNGWVDVRFDDAKSLSSRVSTEKAPPGGTK